MKTVTTRFARIKNGLPYAAVVSLTLMPNATEQRIEISCDGDPRAGLSQGNIEEATKIGYEDWKSGAQAGVVFALKVADQTMCHVQIMRIRGMLTDTNPTIVGAAAALATWEALEFEPPQEVITRLEEQVFSSWSLAWDAIPQFS
ncbi:hypothetical protein [Armatimonas sp.]|uniref:hypothetical protein n=1 Tax=Armatimonas sp. TaxID=1872638 RepID=UPI003751F44C